MMYATHKAGGALFALAGYKVLEANNLLVPNLEPWLQLVIMYPAASFGSTFPDLDHVWNNVKEKTPLNALFHFLIHLTKPKHRSWQTHCIVLNIAFLGVLFSIVYAMSVIPQTFISTIGIALLRLVFTGFGLGLFSHLVLDSFTRQGVHLVPGVMVRLVPNKEMFGTDTTYERVVRGLLYVATVIVLLWIVLSPLNLQDKLLGGG